MLSGASPSFNFLFLSAFSSGFHATRLPHFFYPQSSLLHGQLSNPSKIINKTHSWGFLFLISPICDVHAWIRHTWWFSKCICAASLHTLCRYLLRGKWYPTFFPLHQLLEWINVPRLTSAHFRTQPTSLRVEIFHSLSAIIAPSVHDFSLLWRWRTPLSFFTWSWDRLLHGVVNFNPHKSFSCTTLSLLFPIFCFFVSALSNSNIVLYIFLVHHIITWTLFSKKTVTFRRTVSEHIPIVGIAFLAGSYPRWIKCLQPFSVSFKSRGRLWRSASLESIDIDLPSLFRTASR